MTGEIDRDEERREKPPNQQKEEREKLHSGIIYALLLSFYFGTEETVEWSKWRFPVLLLFLSPTTTKAPWFFPSLSWVEWGFLTIPWLCLFHLFFHIIPWCAPSLSLLLLFSSVVEVNQVTRQQQGSQFHLWVLSLYRAWCSGISTLENCAK